MFKNLTKSKVILGQIKKNLWTANTHLSTVPAAKRVDEFNITPGGSYSGFNCKRVEYIPDFNMTAVEFEHEKTGLQYIHVDRNDSNNVFSINFRTTPFDSTGIPHILEHSVLCGSKKFPVRDPFFKMLNRSLATFMNAMTGPDYTLYPFSSTNEKDYRNLQSIYLDAVFKPNLKYLDFLQEGWRLEHKELENKDSDLHFKGVVYNEMKGAFSENSSHFNQKFFNQLLPEHTYGYVSGGDPLAIPDLTHQDLVNFHKKYYHPSNARMYSYGNFDLMRTLDYVNSEYLKDYEKIDSTHSRVPNQTRWTKPRRSHIYSRFDNMGAAMEKQNQIAFGFLMNDIRDTQSNFETYFLTELLIKGPNSYFYKSFIEPNISGGYSPITGYDSNLKDTMFAVGLQDVDKKDFEKIEKIFDETIDKAIKEGFEQSHMDSVIHNIELMMKHQSTKFGLGMLFNLTPLLNHEGDVIKSINVSEQIKKLKENIKSNPKYLQEKIKQHFKDNKHKLVMTMSPQEDFEQEFNEKENKNLTNKIDSLKSTDKARIYEDGLKLASSQKAIEDINILPCLKLEDIKSDIEQTNLVIENFANVSTQVVTADTNGVVYFRGFWDASLLSDAQKKLLPLFAQVLDQFGTTKMDYRQFDTLINTKTAGLRFNIHVSEHINDRGLYEVALQFGSHCLKENVESMFQIFSDLITNVNFNDPKRFEMLLFQYLSALAVGIADSGHLYAMQNANGIVTESGKLKESMMGIEHLEYMKKLLMANVPDQIFEEIKNIAKILLSQAPTRCALNISQPDSEDGLKYYQNFLSQVPQTSGQKNVVWNESKLLKSSGRLNLMNIPVNYCAKSLVTVPYTHKDYPALRVLARILSAKYLLPVVREQNGAYGAGAKINMDGLFNFFSYRDPNSRKTLDTFDDSYKWVQENLKSTIDSQVLFEAKLGILQQLDAPVAPSDLGQENFKYGINHGEFVRNRQKVLDVTKADVEKVTGKYLNNQKLVFGKSVIGPPQKGLEKDGEEWTESTACT